MYHEEKWIDGVLFFRSTPTGNWIEAGSVLLCRKLLEAEAALAQRAEVDAPRWIPVSERLPEIGRNVLAYTPKSDRKVKALARFIPYEGAPDERGSWDNAYPGTGNCHVFTAVTHWMELPPGPESP